MGGAIEDFGLRLIKEGEATVFAAWERAERPYPWASTAFPASTIVGESDGVVRAYAVVQVVGEEAYLSNFMVVTAMRRRGIGAEFLQKVMMWATSQGAERILLDVDTANLPAIGLYLKLGFDFVQRREQSYPRGEDAFIMRKNL